MKKYFLLLILIFSVNSINAQTKKSKKISLPAGFNSWSTTEQREWYNTDEGTLYLNQSVFNKSTASKTKPKKAPITRKCECCGVVFKIVNGWGYESETVFKFGDFDEQAHNIQYSYLNSALGGKNEYHPFIKYHSRECAFKCGN